MYYRSFSIYVFVNTLWKALPKEIFGSRARYIYEKLDETHLALHRLGVGYHRFKKSRNDFLMDKPLRHKFNLAGGETNHFEQQPTMTPAGNISVSVCPFPVTDGNVFHL